MCLEQHTRTPLLHSDSGVCPRCSGTPHAALTAESWSRQVKVSVLPSLLSKFFSRFLFSYLNKLVTNEKNSFRNY